MDCDLEICSALAVNMLLLLFLGTVCQNLSSLLVLYDSFKALRIC